MRATIRSHYTHDVDNGDGSVSTSYGRVCYAHGPGALCGGYHQVDEHEQREIREYGRDWDRAFRGRFERLSGGVPIDAYHHLQMRLDLLQRRWRDEDFLLPQDAAAQAWELLADKPAGHTNVRPLPRAAWL